MAHLVWDWNGTLLDDITLVVAATNASLASVGGPTVTVDEHRRDFRRPISAYYEFALGRPLDGRRVRRPGPRSSTTRTGSGWPTPAWPPTRWDAIAAWSGSQSLLSMFFHDELVAGRHRARARSASVPSGRSARRHRRRPQGTAPAGTPGRRSASPARDCVLIGDSVDDAHAADEVGAAVVLYAGGFTHENRLRETGRPVATSLVAAVKLAHDAGAFAA